MPARPKIHLARRSKIVCGWYRKGGVVHTDAIENVTCLRCIEKWLAELTK